MPLEESKSGYYDVSKHFLDFAERLAAIGDKIAKRRSGERNQLALYLDKIATVVDRIRLSFEEEQPPYSGCAELSEYVTTLAEVLARELPNEAARFEHVLSGAVLARGVLFIEHDAGSREAAFRDLSEAAGRFRALANRLRLDPPDENLEYLSKALGNWSPNGTGSSRMKTILFLAANPPSTSPLKLDEEAREIEKQIRAAEHRDSLCLKTRWAVRPDDLLQALNEDRPVIVHFAGHGSGTPGIVLHDERGSTKLVSATMLNRVFTALRGSIRVVVFSACFSQEQAKAIVRVIDCVVGIEDSIDDEAARIFTGSFYRALGFGQSVQNAFDQGVTAVELYGCPRAVTPRLFVRETVDPTNLTLLSVQD